MKILYVHLSLPGRGMGGADKVVWDLARSMKEIYHEEVAAVLNPGELADRFETLQIPVTEIFWSKFKTGQTSSRLRQRIRTFQPDVIHSHHRYTTFLLDLFFRKGNILLHTEHVLRRSKRWLFRYGHFATAVSDSVRENLAHHYRVPLDRVTTLRNAVSLRPVNSAWFQDFQHKYPRRPGDIFILCSGRLDEQKGHRYLIEAIARLPDSYRARLKIFIAGEGRLETFLRREAARRGVEAPFVFLGFTPFIPELLSLCDFLILPSLYEGLPLVVLEAFSAGKPVIATDIPGTREVVENGRNGILVPPRDAGKLANAIERWMNHPEEMGKMGDEAKRFSERYSFEQMILSYHELYQKLVGERVR